MPEVPWGIAYGTGHRNGRSYLHEGEKVTKHKPEPLVDAGPVRITTPDGRHLIKAAYDKDRVRTITQRGEEQPRRSLSIDEIELIQKNKLKYEGDQGSMELWYRHNLKPRRRRRGNKQKAGMNHPGVEVEGGVLLLEVD